MTLGPAIIALAWFEATSPGPSLSKLRNALVTFGRVPLFFYLLQWPMAHTISLLLHLAFGKPVGWLFQTPLDWGNQPAGTGFNLAMVYASVPLFLREALCRIAPMALKERTNCRGVPPWAPRVASDWGAHGGTPLQFVRELPHLAWRNYSSYCKTVLKLSARSRRFRTPRYWPTISLETLRR